MNPQPLTGRVTRTWRTCVRSYTFTISTYVQLNSYSGRHKCPHGYGCMEFAWADGPAWLHGICMGRWACMAAWGLHGQVGLHGCIRFAWAAGPAWLHGGCMGRWACMIAWSHTYTTYSTSFHVRTELRTFTFTELVQVPVTLAGMHAHHAACIF